MPQHTFPDLSAFQQATGQDLGHSDWVTVTQEMVNQFAESTQDFQWIHVDPERAKKETPFGGTIAHGFLTLSLLSGLVESMVKVDSAKMGVNYGLNKVRFTDVVPTGSRLRLQLKIAQIEAMPPNGVKVFWDCVLEREGGKKPACVGEFITLIYE